MDPRKEADVAHDPDAEVASETEAAPRLGYGHPAHKPDPTATYLFRPGPPRTLPLKPAARWRVPG